MAMTDEELLSLVDGEFTMAMGAPDGEISTERAKALDYYLGKELGNEVEGQSHVVTSDVADVVDGLMPSLLRVFTTSENLVDFDPVGPEDIKAAQQESDAVNYYFFKKNPAFMLLYTWFFDALAQKNGIVKAWWDDSETVSTESYQGLTEQELAELLDDEELEPVERAERDGTTFETIPTQFGEQQVEVPVKLHDVVFKRTIKSGSPKVANVPPEEYRISGDSNNLDPSTARMVGQEREITRSELIEMGFDKSIVEDLPSHGDIHDSPEKISRDNKTDDTWDAPRDESQERVLVREAYIRVDYDEDGVSELRQVITAGNQVLSNEEVDRQPFHVISPRPLPHKHFGLSAAERVMDLQEINTTLTRQILDNLYHSNNPGHAVWEQGIGENTLDDLLTTRVGGVKRFARPVAESWAPITVPFTAGQTFPMLEWLEKAKRDRTGISSDGEGLTPDALKNIQTSVLGQALDLGRMKIEAIVRIFAETGIKSLFLHLHELLLKHQTREETVMLRGEWIPINPQEWRTRHNMTVKIGLGIGSKEQNLLHLQTIYAMQKDMAINGGAEVLVNPDNFYSTASEIVKNANLKDPNKFFTNPQGKPFQQGDDPQAEAAQQQLLIAQRQQELDAQKQEMDRQKMMLEHQREVEELRQSQEKINNDLMVKMEEVTNALTKMELEFGRNVPGSKV